MPARPITILAILQMFLIVACFLTVGFFMKVHGYPDGRPWPLGPAFIREKIFFLLALPVIWAAASAFASTRPGYLYRGLLVVGTVFTAAIAFYGIVAIGLAISGPKLPLMQI